ncbi:hypothetical protein [Nocardia sp. NPDC047654]|uniref:hypothetical protein n=1 Tax=Nocardia sp. NPDC047654 TaxID=3364314 RepID=UPI0037238F36
MALYAEIEKLDEDDQQVRYVYRDVHGVEQTLLLNKTQETIVRENGSDDMLYRAVARKIASAWLNSRVAPDRLIVQS